MNSILASPFRITVLEMVLPVENTWARKGDTNLIFGKIPVIRAAEVEKDTAEIQNTDNF